MDVLGEEQGWDQVFDMFQRSELEVCYPDWRSLGQKSSFGSLLVAVKKCLSIGSLRHYL